MRNVEGILVWTNHVGGEVMRNIHDNNPLPSICWKRWNKLEMTWQEAVEEASTLFHLAVQLDEVRKRHKVRRRNPNL